MHPRCALERSEDIEEIRAMLEAGETEIAKTDLVWILSGCPDMIEAHYLLGEIALAEGDLPLARGHFGHAFRAGEKALRATGRGTTLPHKTEANQLFLQCGKGLVYCLVQLGKAEMARDVTNVVLRCDKSDPLGVAAVLRGEPLQPTEPPLVQLELGTEDSDGEDQADETDGSL